MKIERISRGDVIRSRKPRRRRTPKAPKKVERVAMARPDFPSKPLNRDTMDGAAEVKCFGYIAPDSRPPARAGLPPQILARGPEGPMVLRRWKQDMRGMKPGHAYSLKLAGADAARTRRQLRRVARRLGRGFVPLPARDIDEVWFKVNAKEGVLERRFVRRNSAATLWVYRYGRKVLVRPYASAHNHEHTIKPRRIRA